ncbi:hypothetical protein STEG23_027163 [Scotinomys teguina]
MQITVTCKRGFCPRYQGQNSFEVALPPSLNLMAASKSSRNLGTQQQKAAVVSCKHCHDNVTCDNWSLLSEDLPLKLCGGAQQSPCVLCVACSHQEAVDFEDKENHKCPDMLQRIFKNDPSFAHCTQLYIVTSSNPTVLQVMEIFLPPSKNFISPAILLEARQIQQSPAPSYRVGHACYPHLKMRLLFTYGSKPPTENIRLLFTYGSKPPTENIRLLFTYGSKPPTENIRLLFTYGSKPPTENIWLKQVLASYY